MPSYLDLTARERAVANVKNADRYVAECDSATYATVEASLAVAHAMMDVADAIYSLRDELLDR